jgi:hypothetical protein
MVYNLLFSLIFGSLAGWKLTNTNNTLETNIQRIQRRRNTGGMGGQPPPQVLPSALFPEAKCPFLAWKMSFKIAFFAQRTLLKTWIYVICGKLFSFSGKISYIRQIFGYIWKNFSYLGKMWYTRKIFVGMSGKFFWDDLPPPPPLRRLLDAFFYWKSAPQSLPPQLLEASYAPERIFFVLLGKIAEIRISKINKNCSFKPY